MIGKKWYVPVEKWYGTCNFCKEKPVLFWVHRRPQMWPRSLTIGLTPTRKFMGSLKHSRGPAKRLQHHPTALDDVSQCWTRWPNECSMFDATLGIKGLEPKSSQSPKKTNLLHIGLPIKWHETDRPLRRRTIISLFRVLQFHLLLRPFSFYLKGDRLFVRHTVA